MKIAIISDIHSNLEALTAVRLEIEKEAVSQVFCLGDMVGYNANPIEVLQMIQEMNAVCVAGNHDQAAVGMIGTDSFNEVAAAAAQWTMKQLGPKEKAFLQALPLVRRIDEMTLVHATPDQPQEWGYILSVDDARRSFQHLESTYCFIGHSHLPGVFEEKRGLVFFHSGIFEFKTKERYIINVGSVGQPRDKNPKASFVIFDAAARTVDFRRVPYNIAQTQRKILAAGLPEYLAQRLAVGR